MRCVLIIGVDLHAFSICFLLDFVQFITVIDVYLALTNLLLQMQIFFLSHTSGKSFPAVGAPHVSGST